MLKFRTLLTAVSLLSAIWVWAEMPRDYYPDNLEGRSKEDLKTELHKLIKQHTRIEYGSKGTWVVFRESDIREDGTIWDMYSDVTRYFPASGAHRDMNIEHSVPKSWWGDDYPYTVDASFDLHHLVPSDADANSAKSNYALGEVDGTPKFDNGVSRVGKATGYSHNVFEPADQYKGDFARMYMYFVTCYQDYTWVSSGPIMFSTGAYPTLTDYARNLLLKWHRQDPVSAKEIERNNVVYRHQNNRNPYIDYPHLAEHVWGNRTEYAFRFDGSEVAVPKLNVKNDDIISMGSEKLGASHSLQYNIKGENLTSDIDVTVADAENNFSVDTRILTLADLQSAEGATVTIQYHPRNYGTHTARLILASPDFPDDVTLQLKGLCMNETPIIVVVDNLKATYKQTDSDVTLSLRNSEEAVTWYIDYNPIEGNSFSPSKLSVGLHTISFKTASVSGRVRISITQ